MEGKDIILGIVFILVFVFLLCLNFGVRNDNDCFREKAEAYCSSVNQSYKSITPSYHFYCIDERVNQKYIFTDSEVKECQYGWFVK